MPNNIVMPVTRALRVHKGDVVSFVGGGGKTTSMFRLAGELSAAGFRVLTTTTTHISTEQARMAPAAIQLEHLDKLEGILDRHRHCLLTGPPDGKGRVTGISCEWIDRLRKRFGIDCIIVEADGSHSRPLKAPGDHEPVVPACTTILAPIAGLNVLGCLLDDAHTHRPELIASIAGQALGTPVTAETLARVLSHPQGGARQLPAGARLIPVLNRSDDATGLLQASKVAQQLMTNHLVDSVIAASMNRPDPIRAVWHRNAGSPQNGLERV